MIIKNLIFLGIHCIKTWLSKSIVFTFWNYISKNITNFDNYSTNFSHFSSSNSDWYISQKYVNISDKIYISLNRKVAIKYLGWYCRHMKELHWSIERFETCSPCGTRSQGFKIASMRDDKIGKKFNEFPDIRGIETEISLNIRFCYTLYLHLSQNLSKQQKVTSPLINAF